MRHVQETARREVDLRSSCFGAKRATITAKSKLRQRGYFWGLFLLLWLGVTRANDTPPPLVGSPSGHQAFRGCFDFYEVNPPKGMV